MRLCIAIKYTNFFKHLKSAMFVRSWRHNAKSLFLNKKKWKYFWKNNINHTIAPKISIDSKVSMDLFIDILSVFHSGEALYAFLQLLNTVPQLLHKENVLKQIKLSQHNALQLYNDYPQEMYYYSIFVSKMLSSSGKNKNAVYFDFLLSFFSLPYCELQHLRERIENNSNMNMSFFSNYTKNKIFHIVLERFGVSGIYLGQNCILMPEQKRQEYLQGNCQGIAKSFAYVGLIGFYQGNVEIEIYRRLVSYYSALGLLEDNELCYLYPSDIEKKQQQILSRVDIKKMLDIDERFYHRHSALYHNDFKAYVKLFEETYFKEAQSIELFYQLEEFFVLQSKQFLYFDTVEFLKKDTFYYKGDKNKVTKNYPFRLAKQKLQNKQIKPWHYMNDGNAIHIEHLSLKIAYDKQIMQETMYNIELSELSRTDMMSMIQLLDQLPSGVYLFYFHCCDVHLDVLPNSNHVLCIIKDKQKFYYINNLEYACFDQAKRLFHRFLQDMLRQWETVLQYQMNDIVKNKLTIDPNSIDFFVSIYHVAHKDDLLVRDSDVNQEKIVDVLEKECGILSLHSKQSSYLFHYIQGMPEKYKAEIIRYRKLLYHFDSEYNDEDVFNCSLLDVHNAHPKTIFGEIVLDKNKHNHEILEALNVAVQQNRLSLSAINIEDWLLLALEIRNFMFMFDENSGKINRLTQKGMMVKLHKKVYLAKFL